MYRRLLRKLNEQQVRKNDEYEIKRSKNLSKMVETVQNIIGESDDIVQRDFKVGSRLSASLFFVDGLAFDSGIEDRIIRPLIHYAKVNDEYNPEKFVTYLLEEVVTFIEAKEVETFDEAILSLMSGETLLVIDTIDKLILFETRQFNQRGIEEPQSEVIVRGPRDGFNEVLHTNVMLIRRRLRDPNLTVQFGQLGRRSKTDFAIVYVKGITNQDLVEEVRYRLSCIDLDLLSETGVIEQYIEENVMSPFPQVLRTERPDKTIHALTNGKVIVVVDGSPFVLMAPVTFADLMKSTEDNYDRWQISSFIRLLRYFAAFMAVFLPGLYIAMVSYHQGMIPTVFALSIAGTREGVPFPGFIEAFLMEVTFELLREAGIRLPRPIGQTIGIVGGLVIGDAAVRAGIVSPIMVIVVAITAIASFAIPAYNVSITFRLLRFVVMIAAAMFGLFGIVIVYILINIHLVGLRSFGSYYTSPFAPYKFGEWLDLMIRAPLILLKNRPSEPKILDKKRKEM
ncbi:spore germination protein [Alkalihalobacillus sp. MEB130]|uniref:spore germination protein n=1 Tax=Alkalihalobacillus sp. MEB130 TaxID=2976704 RepID=UPI0028DFD923|nr:spore germination protein [Alkalihalobacillus sp. MEB130]MDT8860874.1 spore germination protein [Alkalihalobacillus sp. MEB130]